MFSNRRPVDTSSNLWKGTSIDPRQINPRILDGNLPDVIDINPSTWRLLQRAANAVIESKCVDVKDIILKNLHRYSYCKLTPALRKCLRIAGNQLNLNLTITKEDPLKLQAYIASPIKNDKT